LFLSKSHSRPVARNPIPVTPQSIASSVLKTPIPIVLALKIWFFLPSYRILSVLVENTLQNQQPTSPTLPANLEQRPNSKPVRVHSVSTYCFNY
jgi:hypothetical protein